MRRLTKPLSAFPGDGEDDGFHDYNDEDEDDVDANPYQTLTLQELPQVGVGLGNLSNFAPRGGSVDDLETQGYAVDGDCGVHLETGMRSQKRHTSPSAFATTRPDAGPAVSDPEFAEDEALVHAVLTSVARAGTAVPQTSALHRRHSDVRTGVKRRVRRGTSAAAAGVPRRGHLPAAATRRAGSMYVGRGLGIRKPSSAQETMPQLAGGTRGSLQAILRHVMRSNEEVGRLKERERDRLAGKGLSMDGDSL